MSTSLTLSQVTKQQLRLSPAQIQAMRLLEVPACELLSCINEELTKNPALEEGSDLTSEKEIDDFDQTEGDSDQFSNEDFNNDDTVSDDDSYEPTTTSTRRGHEDIPFSMGTTFSEYLKRQIYLTQMDKPDRHIAKFVVGNIDEDGYLRRTVEELVDDLCFREGLQVTDEKMHEIVKQVKQFEPDGVGAYDLQECLLIQLRKKRPTAAITLALKILEEHFESFSNRKYTKIMQRMAITEDQFKQATAEIVHLNPKPGNAWVGTVVERNQSIVIPDFIVKQEGDDLTIVVNHGDIPELHVSTSYQKILDEDSQPHSHTSTYKHEDVQFIKTYVDNAKYFIEAIRQRYETMTRTIKVLVALQHDFFMQGDSMYLKPLTLDDVASRTGYDISTISRTFKDKYVQTEFGVFPMKFFFSEKMTNNEGQDISTREIKQKLQEVIRQEDKTNPITDDQLVQILHNAGYPIARRTVAKYRQQLNIPVARMRQQLIK